MKSLSFWVVLLIALTFLSCNKEIDTKSSITAPFQASDAVIRQNFDFSYDLASDIYSICTPETIRLIGTGYVKVRYMFRDNAYHANITSRISNAKGVGLTSGKIYTITARSHEVVIRNSVNGPQEIENHKERYVIKTEGDEQTYVAVGNLSWKFDESGNLIRQKVEFSVDCK